MLEILTVLLACAGTWTLPIFPDKAITFVYDQQGTYAGCVRIDGTTETWDVDGVCYGQKMDNVWLWGGL